MTASTYPLARSGAGRLSTMARPSGGERLTQELAALAEGGAQVLVSLLTDEESVDLGLAGEADAARAAGLELLRMPVPDLTVPDVEETLALALALAGRLAGGADVVVHCRAGIGRSSLLAAAVLVCEGVEVEEAWRLVEDARGVPVPDTAEQRAFLSELARRRAVRVHRDLHREG